MYKDILRKIVRDAGKIPEKDGPDLTTQAIVCLYLLMTNGKFNTSDNSDGSTPVLPDDFNAFYTSKDPSTIDVGGIPKGFTAPNGISFQDYAYKQLHKFLSPSITSFGIRNQAITLEVGASLPAGLTFTFGVSNPDSVKKNSMYIVDVTGGGSKIAQDFNNTSPVTSQSTTVIKDISTTHTYRLFMTDKENVKYQKDTAVAWQWRVYYGESANESLTAEDIIKLRKSALMGSFVGDFSFNAGGYKFLAYPKSFNRVRRFYDPNTTFDVPMNSPYEVTISNAYGISTTYYVYRSTYELGGSITIKTTN